MTGPPSIVTVIPGDGVGPEVMRAVISVLEAAGIALEFEEMEAGESALAREGSPLPTRTMDSIERNGVALKGPLTTPLGSGFRSVNVQIRKDLELFANVRPARTLLPGGRYEDIDLVLVRENTEGLYIGVEHYIGVAGDPKAAAESITVATRYASERIVRFAFDYAKEHGRSKVTLAHKANILKCTQGLFLEAGRSTAPAYDGVVAFEDRIVDATAMYLVTDPYRFDVIVTTNMLGDILSDQIAGLVGGLGFAPAANIGARHAVFEAVHGSAPDIAGQGIANPTSLLLSACLMLEHLGMSADARRIRRAVSEVIGTGAARTRDMGGQDGTRAFARAIIRHLAD